MIDVGPATLTAKGRPQRTYFNGPYKLKADNHGHSLKVSWVRFIFMRAFAGLTFSQKAPVNEWLSDFVAMMPDGYEFAGELDCSTTGEDKWFDRAMKYENYKGKVLIVIAPKRDKPPAKERIAKIIFWNFKAGDFVDKAYFTTLEELKKDATGRVWFNYESGDKNPGFTLEELWKKAD